MQRKLKQLNLFLTIALVFLISSHCSLYRGLIGPVGPDGAKAAYNRGDYATAFEEFSILAEQGDPKAQFNLGLMYQEGQGTPRNYAQAAKWYRKAAHQGIASAQNNLGLLYHDGHGVPQDYVQAATWFRRAADQGDPEAQNNLGVMYYRSEEVPLDYVEAYKWFKLSSQAGNRNAAKRRDFLAGKMTPQQLEQAENLVKAWKPKKEPNQP